MRRLARSLVRDEARANDQAKPHDDLGKEVTPDRCCTEPRSKLYRFSFCTSAVCTDRQSVQIRLAGCTTRTVQVFHAELRIFCARSNCLNHRGFLPKSSKVQGGVARNCLWSTRSSTFSTTELILPEGDGTHALNDLLCSSRIDEALPLRALDSNRGEEECFLPLTLSAFSISRRRSSS